MAQKLDKRLEGEGHDIKEVVEYAGKYGVFHTCTKYQAGYEAMRRLVIEQTGDENYGKSPQFTRLTTTPGKTMVEEFFSRLEDCIKNKILKMEAKIARQNEYIELLELELKNCRDRQIDDIEAGLIRVAEACRVED